MDCKTTLNAIIEILKLKTKHFGAIAIITVILLISDDKFLNKLGLENFANKYRKWIGIIALISVTYLFVEFIIKVSKLMKTKIEKLKNFKLTKNILHNLTYEEKNILRYYLLNNTRTQELNANGIVKELEIFNIIYKATSHYVGDIYNVHFDYNINPNVWKYLNKHTELLKLNNDKNISKNL